MNQYRSSFLLVAFAGLATALMGAWTMYQEIMPNLRGGTSPVTRIAAMPDGAAPIGLTLLSRHQALLDCDTTLRSAHALEMQYLAADDQRRLPAICADMASRIVAQGPADSFAWYIRAAAAAALDDSATFNTALNRSQLTGPHEGWIADMRVGLAENNLTRLDSQAMAQHNLDLQLVASTNRYRWRTVGRFVRDAAFRERMTAQLDALEPTAQRRFLASVRRILTASGR